MLLDLARTLRDYPARVRRRAELARRALTAPSGAPVVAFGGAGPRAGEIIHGGRVKLLELARAFPCSEEQFNILYLVSSAIPAHAREIVKWARRGGAKFVWNQNGVGFPAWAGKDVARVNRPMTELLLLADFVVYQSEFCRESADRWLGPAPGRSEILFNPVNLDAFSPPPEPLPPEPWRLLAAGTHHQSFRVLGAIETLRLLRQAGRRATLTIAGELRWSSAAAEVRDALQRSGLGDAVELRPPFTQTGAAQLLRSNHVLLHVKYHDPCPTMVIEALACGVPVIGSRTGGMPELLGDDGGELLDVPVTWDRSAYPTPEAIAGEVERIMASWSERSRAARARAECSFSADRWVQAHAELFQLLLSTESSRS
jgi:glycosyltransferase involved in cell wall biosynthesis